MPTRSADRRPDSGLKLGLAALFLGWVYVGTFAAYPIIAGFTELTSLQEVNRTLSIVIRASIVLAAIVLLLGVGRNPRQLWEYPLLWLAVLLWAMWFGRWAHTVWTGAPTLRPPEEYALFAIGSVIPMLAAMQPAGTESIERARRWVLVGLIVAVAINMAGPNGIELISGSRQRFESPRLNPISFGHLGASLALVALLHLLRRSRRRLSFSLLALCGVVLGLGATVVSASRGPLVALVLTLAILAMLRRTRLRHRIAVAVAAGGALIIAAVAVDGSLDRSIERFVTTGSELDTSGEVRMRLWERATRLIIEQPITGGSLELYHLGNHPHNLVLEVLLTTGIPGGLIVMCLLFWGFLLSLREIRSASPYSWICVLYLQYVIAALFSGAIYLEANMWVAFGGTVAASIVRRGGLIGSPHGLNLGGASRSASLAPSHCSLDVPKD